MIEAEKIILPESKHACPMCGGLGYLFKKWTVLRALMGWEPKEVMRPLVFKDEQGNLRDNVASCENSQELFMYEPGFEGMKKRDIYVVDADES